MFRYLVLGLLRDATPRHGYALMKEYRARSGHQVSTGNFYRELQRLDREQLVRAAVNPEGADARRVPHAITDAGAAAFDRWLTSCDATGLGHYEDDLSARALFLAQADPEVVRRALERWQEALWIKGKTIEQERERALAAGSPGEPAEFGALPLLLTRRLKHIVADLEFLEEFRTAYETWLARGRP